MKKILCGFAWILLGIAMILASFTPIWIPIIEETLLLTWIGIISAIIGLVIVIRESKKP